MKDFNYNKFIGNGITFNKGRSVALYNKEIKDWDYMYKKNKDLKNWIRMWSNA